MNWLKKFLEWLASLFKRHVPVPPKPIEPPPMRPPTPFEIAEREYHKGVREIPGEHDNADILKYAIAVDDASAVNHDEVAWCARFVGWCVMEARRLGWQGPKETRKSNARSYLKWSNEVKLPYIGDVVVFWRNSPDSWEGHVGFVCEIRDDKILVLGGNQNDMLCYEWFPLNKVLGFRR